MLHTLRTNAEDFFLWEKIRTILRWEIQMLWVWDRNKRRVWRLRKVGVCWHLRALFGITIEEIFGKMNGFTNRKMYFDDTSWQNYRLTKTNGTLKNTKTTSWIPLGTDHIKSICNVIITTQLNNECHVYIKHWTIFSSNKREREST